ncbi:MAG: peptidyl-prolyl cis-trans isomerase [Pelovirga sp.]
MIHPDHNKNTDFQSESCYFSASTNKHPWRIKLSGFHRCLLTLIITVGLFACQENVSTDAIQDQAPSSATPLIVVGERTLTLEQFNRHMRMNYPDLDKLSPQETFLLQQQLIAQLIDRELILAEAARLDIRLSPDEMDEALAGIRGSDSRVDLEEHLQESGKNPQLWRDVLTFQLLVTKLMDAVVTPRIEISDADIEAYYHNHKEEFRRPTEVRVHQMLFSSRDAALEIKKHLQDGADFATLAKQHSLSPDSKDGGQLGYFPAGQLPPEFDEVIFSLPLRQVSKPVASPYGFHLLMVDRKRRAGLRPFAAVREEITELLYDHQEETLFQQWITDLRNKTTIRVDWQQILPEQHAVEKEM